MTDSQIDRMNIAGSRIDSLTLRATLAMRVEDLRIARKHRDEAAARRMTLGNAVAHRRAAEWEATCRVLEQAARAAVIADGGL